MEFSWFKIIILSFVIWLLYFSIGGSRRSEGVMKYEEEFQINDELNRIFFHNSNSKSILSNLLNKDLIKQKVTMN